VPCATRPRINVLPPGFSEPGSRIGSSSLCPMEALSLIDVSSTGPSGPRGGAEAGPRAFRGTEHGLRCRHRALRSSAAARRSGRGASTGAPTRSEALSTGSSEPGGGADLRRRAPRGAGMQTTSGRWVLRSPAATGGAQSGFLPEPGRRSTAVDGFFGARRPLETTRSVLAGVRTRPPAAPDGSSEPDGSAGDHR